MGYNTFLHAGPFVELLLPAVAKGHDRCMRQPCDTPVTKNTGYCETCGMELKNRFQSWERPNPDPRTLLDEKFLNSFNIDPLRAENENGFFRIVLLPNRHYTLTKEHWCLDEEESLRLNLDARNQQDEAKAFEEAYASELSLLRETYGDAVTIKWDVLTYTY